MSGMGLPMQMEGFMKALEGNPLAAGVVGQVAEKVGNVAQSAVNSFSKSKGEIPKEETSVKEVKTEEIDKARKKLDEK